MAKSTKVKFSAAGLAGLKKGDWANDTGHVGTGQFQARGLGGGACNFYYRYTAPRQSPDDKQVQVRIPIGTFPTMTLKGAREIAREHSLRIQSGDRDLRSALHADEVAEQRRKDAAEAAKAAKTIASLGALLEGYCDVLERDGKASAGSVRGCLIRHVQTPWPKLWSKAAAEVTTDDLLDVVAKVHDAKRRNGKPKLREAAKVRSYLRAAYGAAIKARQSAAGLPALRALKLSRNPATDLATIEGASVAGERALSVAELRHYWRRVCALPGAPGAALRFHLLTGAQRVRQLARLTTSDRDVDSQTVRIIDSKGRRKVARKHDVPLIPAAQEALDDMRGDAPAGDFLFTLTGGLTALTYESLRDWVVIVRDQMAEAGELDGGPFTVGDLRRTVETRLAGAKVSKDIRAQLQSHGLGGVQDRNYDRYEYLDEKIGALETLHRLLTGKDAKVTLIKDAKRKPSAK